jgi:hypothetical protein
MLAPSISSIAAHASGFLNPVWRGRDAAVAPCRSGRPYQDAPRSSSLTGWPQPRRGRPSDNHHPMHSVNSFDLAQFLVAIAPADQAIAIVLDLVDPLRPGRHSARKRRQARLDEAGRMMDGGSASACDLIPPKLSLRPRPSQNAQPTAGGASKCQSANKARSQAYASIRPIGGEALDDVQ